MKRRILSLLKAVSPQKWFSPETQTGVIRWGGWAACGWVHFFHLTAIPGLHYDEAWAGQFAHRIAFEPHFWPIQAMSPYTVSWFHTAVAWVFRTFGTSLLAFRATGLSFTFAGIALLCRALRIQGEKSAASLLPWIVATAPSLVINQRFCLEITTFHVFCFGLLSWGIASLNQNRALKRYWVAIGIAVLLGVTSHILFLAVTLSCWLLFAPVLLPWEISVVRGLSLILGLFFIHVHQQIPEKEKTTALLVLCLGICVLNWQHLLAVYLRPPGLKTFLRSVFQRLDQKFKPKKGPILWKKWNAAGLKIQGAWNLWVHLFHLVSLGIFLFFWEGSWAALFFTGQSLGPRWTGSTLIAPFLLICWSTPLPALRRWQQSWPWGLLWQTRTFTRTALFLILWTTLLISTKPAPRYLELPLLLWALFFTVGATRLSTWKKRMVFGIHILAGTGLLLNQYFLPIQRGEVIRQSIQWGFLKDSTADTFPTQWIAQCLGEEGCLFSQVRSSNTRFLACLAFLSHGDWPVSLKKCPRSTEIFLSPPLLQTKCGSI